MPEAAQRAVQVTIVAPFGEVGGAELWLLRLLDATERVQARVILLRDGPLRAELASRGIDTTVLPVGRRPLDLLLGSWRLGRAILDSDPDVVVGNGVKAQAVLGPACWYLGIPQVWVKHDHSYDRWLTPGLARLATRVVTTSKELVAPTRRADCLVINPPRPPTAPYPRDKAAAELETLAGATTLRTLVMLTRLTPYKGVDTAIRSLALPGGAGWRLVVLGDRDPAEPAELDRLTKLSTELGVTDRVVFTGYVPDAAALLPACDALAVLTRPAGPRTPGREGFGMAAMEAMLAGIPVIAPDDGGPVSQRTRDGAGVLVDATDPASVAHALDQLAVETREGCCEEARCRAEALFESATQASRRFSAVLAQAANRPGAGLASSRPVSVVTPVLNEARVIDRLLLPICAQLSGEDELVVVDSGSTDGTRQRVARIAEADPRVRLLEVSPCTIADSRNHGVRAARHDVIACTDAGCEVDPGWLDGFRGALAEVDQPALLLGVFRAAAGRRLFEAAFAAVAWPDPVELRRSSLPFRVWLHTIGPRYSPSRVDGRSVCFSRETFTRAGGFRSGLHTAEDEAFGRDAIAGGARPAIVADAAVTWFQRDTWRLAFRQFRGYGRGAAAGGSPAQYRTDLLRVAGYATVVAAALHGGRVGRLIACSLPMAGLAFPTARILRRRQPLLAIALLPVAQVTKDLGKLLGMTEGLVLGRRGPLRRPQ